MLTEKKIKMNMGLILQISMISAILLVVLGGVMFLWEHGSEPLSQHLTTNVSHSFNVFSLFQHAMLTTPLGLIQLGIVILVLAQVLRVALLCGYYTYIRDYWFMLFSYFILAVLVYSLIWQ